ncbi:hypothetical protein PGTUg99_009595 [Puccinia graminis f. sp. tritici]|uniref:Uncharacterized protein n=1 Tax=Puccinia graminis f. sp. tritici TaxID=56615 RepID=A0A5B0SGE8_PUCGR|nr:hypothetical protein PGTUg99_009595 [Puccinia graminis f. sp. tritici]
MGRMWGRIWSTGIDESDGRVVGDEGQYVPAWGEADVVDPAAGGSGEVATDRVERNSLAPDRRSRLRVDPLDVSAEDPTGGIGRAGGKQDRVGMPGQTEDGRTEWLFEMLGHPPVRFVVILTHRNCPRPRSYRKLSLVR